MEAPRRTVAGPEVCGGAVLEESSGKAKSPDLEAECAKVGGQGGESAASPTE